MMSLLRTSTCLVALAALVPGLAGAQIIDHLPKPSATHLLSALNPAPMAKGNNQNQGRWSADLLLGITDANRPFSALPYARMGLGESASIRPDIWPFPQPTTGAETQFQHNGSYFDLGGQIPSNALFPRVFADDQMTSVPLPLAETTPIAVADPAVVALDPGWIQKGAPSTDVAGLPTGTALYHCTPPTAPAAAARRFVWYPRVQGRAGEYQRHAIRIHIPQPEPSNASPRTEVRVDDARYLVTYHEPIAPGRFRVVAREFILSQTVGGDFYLANPEDGTRAYFPMATERSYSAANPVNPAIGGSTVFVEGRTPAQLAITGATRRASVTLLSTHESPQSNEVVIADAVQFIPHNFAIYAAPTLVGPHGGRKKSATPTPPLAIEQPDGGPNYATNPMPAPGGTIAHPNDSFDFANNPRDPAFSAATGDRANPSVLFQGPVSTIDPRDASGAPTSPVNAVNHGAYRNGPDQIPFFSHAQVIFVRTDFLPVPGAARRTRPVTSIWCVDSTTRTVIWRFPDRTHLPPTPANTALTPLAGLRNRQIGITPNGTRVPGGTPVYQIQNVIASDGGSVGNPDGRIGDDEVFLDGDFTDRAHASVTLVPGISVFGTAQVPTYDATNTNMVGVTNSAPERYSMPGTPRQPIQMPVAFVALPNGTLLALDPFGNNDNRYFEHAADTTRLGNFRNGTTNVLWVFEPRSHPRQLEQELGPSAKEAETVLRYNQRLKSEIPVPAGYGASAPVVAWERSDDDPTLNTAAQEPRLFVGNQNGVLYALDARAIANGVDATGRPRPLGFRKGEQIDSNYKGIDYTGFSLFEAEANDHRQELKWWFRTLAGAQGGGINATPAVSAWAHPRASVPTGSKGVYVTSGEGRIYCLDWQGPVTRDNHEANMTFSGFPGSPTAATPTAGTAAAFNDDRWFHNVQVATSNAPEFQEGTVRPRWAFPNTYQNTRAALRFEFETPDFSAVFGTSRLANRQAGFAPIESAPTLIDFPYLDPDDNRLSGVRRYVAVAVNDPTTSTNPSPRGRLLLLDQIGDRRDFLTNPMPQQAIGLSTPFAAAVPAANTRIVGLPLDQWVNPLPGALFARSSISWIYRPVYDQYTPAGAPIIQQRNAPSTAADPAQPARRPVPTLYVGGAPQGGKARLYAIDIDEDTGLLARYRDGGQPQEQALPTDTVIPGPLWDGNPAHAGLSDLLNPNDPTNPVNPMLRVGPKDAYAYNRILARTVAIDGDDTAVESITITGGPLQNRNNSTAKAAADALPTLPVTVGPPVDATHPSVPLLPTDDAPVVALALGNITNFSYNMGAAPPILPTTDLTARYVNQDIDDPLTTSRGAFNGAGVPPADLPNVAYQYPVLWVTTHGDDSRPGSLYEISSNIEGEDGDNTLGWALIEGSLNRANLSHVFQMELPGFGGPGSGVVSFTNAYYESFDRTFPARRQAWRAKLGTDPSADFAYYPEQEPAAQASVHGDAPRPHFRPRPLFEGNPAAAPVPLLADEHTGESGLPLDLNGLFYDKTYETGVTPPVSTNNNENGSYRLPGYSQLGTTASTSPVSDAERLTAFAGAVPRSDDYINVNPAGHRVAWLYVGAEAGLLYEVTPVFRAELGGQINGFGLPRVERRSTTELGLPFAKVDIFDQADYNTLRTPTLAGNARRPRRDPNLPIPADGGVTLDIRSRAAKGSKNIYEWGQRVYIVAWDIPVVAPSYTEDPATGNPLPPVAPPSSFFINLNIGGQTYRVQLPVSGGNVVTYPYLPDYGAGTIPAGFHPSRLGVAFYELVVEGRTPGQKLHVSVVGGSDVHDNGLPPYNLQPRSLNVGTNSTTERDNVEPDYFVANPLGVQGHLVQTVNNFPAAVPNAEGKPMNGIGPFRSAADLSGAHTGAENLVANQGSSDGSRDPDRANFEFSQALANGNQISRLDLSLYDSAGNLNPNYEKQLKDENGANDPTFYVPVAVGLGYAGHGRTATSDIGTNQRNLRIINRSALPTLGNIRARFVRDLNWRWWPATIPNADADADRPGAGASNPRQTPNGMGVDGVINPLPWEVRPNAASAYAPWRPVDPSEATSNIGTSVDYPDIPATTASPNGSRNIAVTIGGQDLTKGPGTLPGYLSGSVNHPGILAPLVPAGGLTTLNTFAASLTVRIPQFQPANLVAMHSLTSSYRLPSVEDGAFTAGVSGPVQLPRRSSVAAPGGAVPGAPRSLHAVDPNTGLVTNQATIAPAGYTAVMEVWVDVNNDGRRDASEPFREVEVWVGVPVDMSLSSSTTSDNRPSVVDLGRIPQGFGMQNGLLGYGSGAGTSGFEPPPLNPLFGAGAPGNPYASYFKTMTVLNTGNVNFWNLRASQKVELPIALGNTFPGTGRSFYYFGLKSNNVDDRFGVLSVGADPLGSLTTPNLMPQVVTSLDPSFDAAWLARHTSNPALAPFYAPFAGRHTLKKPQVGSTTPSILGLPDVPRDDRFAGVRVQPAVVSVAVPLGTPSGVYESAASNVAGAPPMLAVFENHDTRPTGYPAVPVLSGGAIQTAGPTYGGFNGSNFNATFNPTPGTQAIQTADGTPDSNVLRVRQVVAAPGGPQGIYQPHTSPAVELRFTVSEAPLTGMVPDFALSSPISGTPGLFSGLLPGIDRFPLSETLNPLTAVATDRAASSLSPTAYRGADGGMNVYYVRSEAPAATPNARGFKLYHARMAWNAALGTWQASAPGVAVNDPTAAAGGWFSAPVEISTAPGQQSNHSPYVLHANSSAATATLFWVNSVPTAGGGVTDNLVYASLAADGTPAAFAPVALNLDPNLRRYGVRAAFDAPTATTVSLYYGGVAGRWGLYYIPRAASAAGTPVAPVPNAATERRVERSLEIPSAIQSASEPSAIFRRLATVDNGATPVLDVYYTGVLRSTGTPDLFLTRYRMEGTGRNARLTPLTLPVISGERLEQVGRELSWNADHIAWNRSVPIEIRIQYGFRTGGPVVTTNPANWRWDAASQMLFQNITRPGGVLQVLVDTGAGTVRFRGAGVPVRATDQVLATYQPQTYRLTPDGAGDTGAIAFVDPSSLLQTQDATSFNQVLRRPLGDVLAGRTWLLWRKESADKQASSLYSSIRRVGIDLKALGILGQDETLELGPRTANFNSPLAGVAVNVSGVGPVPFDADVKTGKIFVDPFYEGLAAAVTVTKHTAAGSVAVGGNGVLEMIEEQAPVGQNKVGSSALSLAQTVNEGQVFGFVDLFQPVPTTDITGFRVADRAQDPTLQPGRVWMFWASPRARTGRVPVGPGRLDALPRGYDLFWQSLAPRFETSAP